MAVGGGPRERHAALRARLSELQSQKRAWHADTTQFLQDPMAAEKTAASAALRALCAQTTAVTSLCEATGAVVERIANANDVAETMTREVRRIDILQSRLTTTLAQAAQQLALRNAMSGLRRTMQAQRYPEAASHLQQLQAIAAAMPLDVADRLRVDTMESDLKGVIEAAFASGLREQDHERVRTYAPLFQVLGEGYEARGLALLRTFVEDTLQSQLAALTPPPRGAVLSSRELMDQLTTVFNSVAALAQEYDALASQCFARVQGVNALLQALYALGEQSSVAILTAYMQQRQFRQRMSATNVRQDAEAAHHSSGGSGPSSAPSPAVSAAPPRSPTKASEEEVATLNSQLNEMALMIQHTQTYERFLRSRVVTAATTPTHVHDGDGDGAADGDAAIKNEESEERVLPASSESELGKTVQELAGYYCFFENDLLNKAARKAFQWEELRMSSSSSSASSSASAAVANGECFPISSAIDEIFYVARNSGLRALATGHADCGAGVLNMINTLLRDALGDTMRSRIRNMAAHVKLANDSGLMAAASSQLRDQMQQQFAKLSKTMVPIQLGTGVAAAVGVGAGGSGASPGSNGGGHGGGAGSNGVNASGSGSGGGAPSSSTQEIHKELGPDVVMNSLEATAEYVVQLKREFEQELRQDFPEIPSHLQTCLNGLEDACAELTQLLLASRKQLCRVLEPKIASFLGALLAPTARKSVQYELTDQAFTFNEANDPFAYQFVASMRALVATFRPTLSPSNTKCVVEALAECTAALIERWFFARDVRFNQLGALQFDKDVRVLSAFFNEPPSDGRTALATLTQLAMVLNVDTPADVQDFVGRKSRGGVAWQLSVAQVKEALARRVEFADADINRLRL